MLYYQSGQKSQGDVMLLVPYQSNIRCQFVRVDGVCLPYSVYNPIDYSSSLLYSELLDKHEADSGFFVLFVNKKTEKEFRHLKRNFTLHRKSFSFRCHYLKLSSNEQIRIIKVIPQNL